VSNEYFSVYIWIYNGKDYEAFDEGDAATWTTKEEIRKGHH